MLVYASVCVSMCVYVCVCVSACNVSSPYAAIWSTISLILHQSLRAINRVRWSAVISLQTSDIWRHIVTPIMLSLKAITAFDV